MGRQFQFFQLDSDIQDMLIFLKQHHLSVFKKGIILTRVEDLYKEKLVAINNRYIPSIGIVNSPVEYSVPHPIDTTQIETARFYACDSPNFEVRKTEGLKIINEGRFYLSNEYYSDDAVVAVYDLLKKYIKKNYLYSKNRQVYFSEAFIDEYKKGNIYSSQGTNVFPVTDL